MIDAYNEERVLKYNERQFKKIAKIMIYMKLVKYLFYILMLLGVYGHKRATYAWENYSIMAIGLRWKRNIL